MSKRKAQLPAAAMVNNLKEFKIKRSDLLADLQNQILKQITADKLEKASVQQLITAFAIAYDKERLEQNKSTENVAHQVSEGLSEKDKEAFRKLMQERTARLRQEVVYEDDE